MARAPVMTPALEGSRRLEPINGRFPMRPYSRAGPASMYDLSPRPIPPISSRMVMPPQQRPRYMGPTSLKPWWGGYSVGNRYIPGIARLKKDTKGHQQGPVSGAPPPGPRGPSGPRPQVPLQQGPPPQPQQQRNNVVQVPVYIKRPPPQQVPVVPQRVTVPKKPVSTKKTKRPKIGSALWRFRYVVIAVVFIEHLRTNIRKKVSNRPSSVFLFGIILKEIVAALHKIYLNPNGNIYPVLCDIIGPNCYDLGALIHGPIKDQQEFKVLIQELQYVLENICYHITEIMPSTGVLGTHRRSAVCELVRNGKRFPEGYFWQAEMERLQFTEHGRTVNVGEYEAFMLLVGIFLSRSMVTTLLMKPMDYGLSSTPLSDIAERNLRVVASAFIFLLRRITTTRTDGMMQMPQEIARYLYDDNEMQNINAQLSSTYNYCEGLLREWGAEYLRRLRASVAQP